MIYTIIHEYILYMYMCYPEGAGRTGERSVSFLRPDRANGEKGMYAANALKYTE